MIYPIILYGDEFLRKKAIDFSLNEDVKDIVSNMFETMYEANGVGLASTQVGIEKRLIVINQKLDEEIFKSVFINPKITAFEGKLYSMVEGCLSLPGISGKVIRPFTIELEWYDENWNFHKEKFDGIKSRILQHEMDHLHGILYVDRIHPDERLKLFMQLEDIKNRKIKVNYFIK